MFQLPPGAIAAWGEPIMQWNFGDASAGSVVVASTSIDFKDLANYRDLMIFGTSLTTDTGTTDTLDAKVSSDNASTFLTVYDTYGSAATNRIAMTGGGAIAIVHGFQLEFWDFNVAARRTKYRCTGGQKGSSTSLTTKIGERTAGEVDNAVRIFCSGGANITAGSLRLYGRRG